MKRFLAALLVLALIAASVVTALADTPWGTSIMYVKTANGKPVNVRSGPGKEYDAIGSAPYGHQVLTDWSYAGNDGWTKVVWGGAGDGYIMSRFLVDYDPGKAPEPSKKEKEKQSDAENNLQMLEGLTDGYKVSIQKETADAWYLRCTKTADNKDKDAPKRMDLVVSKETHLPLLFTASISIVTMTMKDIALGVTEEQVTFDPAKYPDATIIDQR